MLIPAPHLPSEGKMPEAPPPQMSPDKECARDSGKSRMRQPPLAYPDWMRQYDIGSVDAPRRSGHGGKEGRRGRGEIEVQSGGRAVKQVASNGVDRALYRYGSEPLVWAPRAMVPANPKGRPNAAGGGIVWLEARRNDRRRAESSGARERSTRPRRTRREPQPFGGLGVRPAR